jgi:hypothetical protein
LAKATQQEINSFLLQIKMLIEDSENFTLRSDRLINEETLLKLGYTPENACDELLTLTYKNYVSGPEGNISKDGHKNGEIWEFGKVINSLDIYIKFHIYAFKGITCAICVSFHEAKFTLNYCHKS